jgi:hypothetical protein
MFGCPPYDQTDVQVGVSVRVIVIRWDAPTGTLARVESVGLSEILHVWYFTVRWLHREGLPARLRGLSRNLFEEDLTDFEVYPDSIGERPARNRQSRRAMISVQPSAQLCLPFTRDESVSDGAPTESYHLYSRPVWDFDLDV